MYMLHAKTWVIPCIAGLIALQPAPTFAAEPNVSRMAELTRDMVTEAVDFFVANGYDASREAFGLTERNYWFTDEYNLHMFGMTAEGIVWADGAWPAFVGTDFREMTDFNGFAFGKAILNETPDNGEVYRIELQFMNSEQSRITVSIGHCARPNTDHVLCSWTNADR